MSLSIENLTFARESFSLLVTSSIPQGSFTVVLGPSGSGKSTLLNLLAGLLVPQGGTIELLGKDITKLPPEQRNIGYVFQDYALFPHMTVIQNIAYPIKQRSPHAGKVNTTNRVSELLMLCQLQGLENRRPHELSGGQQQRVALARALASNPSLLILDEPLSALDQGLRTELLNQTLAIHRATGLTTLYITHDHEEALLYADWLLVLEEGRVVAQGKPLEIYARPPSPSVALLLGEASFIPVEVLRQSNPRLLPQGGTVVVRPHHWQLQPQEPPAGGLIWKQDLEILDIKTLPARHRLIARAKTSAYQGNLIIELPWDHQNPKDINLSGMVQWSVLP